MLKLEANLEIWLIHGVNTQKSQKTAILVTVKSKLELIHLRILLLYYTKNLDWIGGNKCKTTEPSLEMSRGIEKSKQSKVFRETRAQVWKVTEQREETWRNLKSQGHPPNWMLNNMTAGTQDKVCTKRSQKFEKQAQNYTNNNRG